MAQPSRLCSKADIENILGPKALVQLTDEMREGQAWDDLVFAAIEFCTAQVLSAWQVQNNIEGLAVPYPPLLVHTTAGLSAAEVWRRGAHGQAMPKHVAGGEERCDKMMSMWVDRKRSPGTTPEQDNQQPTWQVDPDPDGTGYTRQGCRGLW